MRIAVLIAFLPFIISSTASQNDLDPHLAGKKIINLNPLFEYLSGPLPPDPVFKVRKIIPNPDKAWPYEVDHMLFAYSLIALGVVFRDVEQNGRQRLLSIISDSFEGNESIRHLVKWSSVGILNPEAPISSIVYLFENKELNEECEYALIEALKRSLELCTACYYLQLQRGNQIPFPYPENDIIYMLRVSFVTQHNFKDFRHEYLNENLISNFASLILIGKTLKGIDTDFLIKFAEEKGIAQDIKSVIVFSSFYESAISLYPGNLAEDMPDEISMEILLGVGCGLLLTDLQRAKYLSLGKYSSFSSILLKPMDRSELLQEAYHKLNQTSRLSMISVLDERDFTFLFRSVWNNYLIKEPSSQTKESLLDLEPFVHFSYTDERNYLACTNISSKHSNIALADIIEYIGADVSRAVFFTNVLPILPFVFLFTNSMDVNMHLSKEADSYALLSCYVRFMKNYSKYYNEGVRIRAQTRATAQRLIRADTVC